MRIVDILKSNFDFRLFYLRIPYLPINCSMLGGEGRREKEGGGEWCDGGMLLSQGKKK